MLQPGPLAIARGCEAPSPQISSRRRTTTFDGTPHESCHFGRWPRDTHPETELRPKQMIAIGGRPIIWHIMKICSHLGVNEIVIRLGYRGYKIKEKIKGSFANCALHVPGVTMDMRKDGIRLG